MIRIKIFILLVITFLSVNLIFADTPKTVSTFQSISLYWSPEGGAENLRVLVKFREEGSTKWREGLPMKYNPIANTENDLTDYRGSIVNLKPNTVYEIELTLEGTSTTEKITAKTWSEDFPIGKTIYLTNSNNRYKIYDSGTPDGYLLIDGTGKTIDVKNKADYCLYVYGSYVIIRGVTLKGATKSGILLSDVHDIVIENCDISGWGEEDGNSGFGKNYQAGVYSLSESLARVVIQRCKIHDPRWGSNSWAELNASGKSNHPSGPQGISFANSAGNHVIRYNEFYTDYDHTFNDIIGYGSNASYKGFPGADSDIYGNYFSHCYDDGIESEGGNRNTRIWGNYIENVFIAIGNAATSIGPLYIWKNTSGRAYSPPRSKYGDYAAFIKMGYAHSIDWMTGHMYIFNNTILQPDGKGTGGLGTSRNGESNRHIRHCVTRNNILHVRSRDNSISTRSSNFDFDYDYDLCSGGYPDGQETHGISGIPNYIDDAKFDSTTMTANFFLNSDSKGIDAGEIIPNFADNYNGSAPDMGAFESGDSPTEYGVNAYLVTGIDDDELQNPAVPEEFSLSQNYPNPFNPTTIINYSISTTGMVVLKVFNILGQEVATLVSEFKNAGKYQVKFNATNLPSGMYIYSLQAGNYTASQKMVLIK